MVMDPDGNQIFKYGAFISAIPRVRRGQCMGALLPLCRAPGVPLAGGVACNVIPPGAEVLRADFPATLEEARVSWPHLEIRCNIEPCGGLNADIILAVMII